MMKQTILKIGLAVFFISVTSNSVAQSAGEAVAKKIGVYVFPTKDQSSAQQEKDMSDCYTWAVQQSGYDPINPTKVQAKEVDQGPDGSAVKGAAGGALVGLAIGSISGDAGKGAAIGAVSGSVLGHRRGAMAKASEQNQANQQAANVNKNMEDGFKKAFEACLEGKNYTVK
ncbi:glycine zipper family protein [Gelidibacter japonicus]|uniref:glycine zipper family protein n=1 Tax=Gelidibacter japonicus TaxID=1962232 RepID=UPI0013D11D72|nr:glycine zipper family protein [Gelidibacter japonicus]